MFLFSDPPDLTGASRLLFVPISYRQIYDPFLLSEVFHPCLFFRRWKSRFYSFRRCESPSKLEREHSLKTSSKRYKIAGDGLMRHLFVHSTGSFLLETRHVQYSCSLIRISPLFSLIFLRRYDRDALNFHGDPSDLLLHLPWNVWRTTDHSRINLGPHSIRQIPCKKAILVLKAQMLGEYRYTYDLSGKKLRRR